MARPLRIEFENAWYHVMNRGASRCATFFKDGHYDVFLKLLGESTCMFGIEIHAYCLMGNHYHLLIRTPFANLSRAMRHIDGVYTQRFNRLERRDGSLFRGRYKAIVIDADNYLVAVSRYIHRNPVEAKLVTDPASYHWSSYPAYVGHTLKSEWLQTSEISRYAGPGGLESYRSLVENPLLPSMNEYYQSGRVAPILGTREFRAMVMSRSTTRANHPEIPESRAKENQVGIGEIITLTAHSFKRDFRSVSGKADLPRSMAMYLARRKFGHSLRQIADAFGCRSYSTVSINVRRFESALEADGELNSIALTVESALRENRNVQT